MISFLMALELSIITSRSYVSLRPFIGDTSQNTSRCEIRIEVTHVTAPRVPLFCFYRSLTSSEIYY